VKIGIGIPSGFDLTIAFRFLHSRYIDPYSPHEDAMQRPASSVANAKVLQILPPSDFDMKSVFRFPRG
jgi:hypothetical protein